MPHPHLCHSNSRCALVIPAVHEIKAMLRLVVEVAIKKAKVKYTFSAIVVELLSVTRSLI
jgi:hypothetical protein